MQHHVNPLLMNAHALPVDIREAHAQAGNHLRVSTHPLLGLPVTPFVVYRAVPDSRKILVKRKVASYIDDVTGLPLSPPFNMQSGQSVSVYLALRQNEQCLWANLIANAEKDGSRDDGRPVIIRPRDDRDGQGAAFHVDAFMASTTGRGPAIIGRRSEVPFTFSAPNIVQLRVHGAGTVFGIEWIEAHDTQRLEYEPYTVMCLPHEGGARYLPIQTPIALAAAHVSAQAPKRLPLQEAPGIPAPGAAPIATILQELQRVASFSGKLEEDLKALIDDTSVPQLEQTVTEHVTDADGKVLLDDKGNPAGSSTTRRLQRVLGALADPGTATGFGYKMRDDTFVEIEDRIVFYRVYGFFEDVGAGASDDVGVEPVQQIVDAAMGLVPPTDRNLEGGLVFKRYATLVKKLSIGKPVGPLKDPIPGKPRSFVMLQTHAIADRQAPLEQPDPVTIRKTLHRTWLPGPPPDARREVEIQLADVRVAGLLAAARRAPAGSGVVEGLNRKNDKGFHLPIVLATNIDDETGDPVGEPGTGFIADRQAAASAIDYAVAQQDRFGRWSEWTSKTASAGLRPKPPRPVVQAYYRQPDIAEAASKGGRVTVFVAVPDAVDLAPGSLELSHARVFINDPLAPLQQHDLAEADKIAVPGQSGSFRVELRIEGPVLALLEQRRLTINARWFDTANRQSVLSENIRLNLVDPRPPLQLSVPPFLLYSARPDVTGLAWVEHRWNAQPGVNHAIYYCDENRLRVHLEQENQAALLAQIDAASDAAVRAGVYRDNAGVFPDYLFERLDDVMADFPGNEVGFRHGVSGSLRVLSVYKIAAESASGSKPDLRDLPIILYGVPNSDPPQQPTLKVRPVEPLSGESDYVVEATITVLAGVTPASTWRLRRTRTGTQRLSNMPIVATGSIGAPDADTGRQSASYRDDGKVLIAPTAQLTPWTRYTYRVEVQGAPESGSSPPVPGRWSVASEPVSVVLIPDSPPGTPALVNLSGTAVAGGMRNVSLTLTHPQRLSGGISGFYTVRVDRRLPGGVLETLGTHDIVQPDEPLRFSGVPDSTSGEVVPLGTLYIVILSDPLGRSAAPLNATLS